MIYFIKPQHYKEGGDGGEIIQSKSKKKIGDQLQNMNMPGMMASGVKVLRKISCLDQHPKMFLYANTRQSVAVQRDGASRLAPKYQL